MRQQVVGFTLLGLGIAGVAAGGTLIALDGEPTCSGVGDPRTICPNVRDTRTSGVVAVTLGSAAIVTGVILIAVGKRQQRRTVAIYLPGRITTLNR